MREEGFYWVKTSGKWIVGRWCNEDQIMYWDVPETVYKKYDNDFEEINETKLTPPQE